MPSQGMQPLLRLSAINTPSARGWALISCRDMEVDVKSVLIPACLGLLTAMIACAPEVDTGRSVQTLVSAPKTYYSFEDGSRPALVSGAISADGRFGKAYLFDGSSYVAIDNLHYESQGSIEALTVCAWAKTEIGGEAQAWTDNAALVDFDRSEYYSLAVRADDGRVAFSTASKRDNDSTQIVDTWSSRAVNDGHWHFICAVYDGQDKVIYVDGQEDARQKNAHEGEPLGSGAVRYGFIGDGSLAETFDGARSQDYYEGFIDEVRIFHEALSVASDGDGDGLNDIEELFIGKDRFKHDSDFESGDSRASTASVCSGKAGVCGASANRNRSSQKPSDIELTSGAGRNVSLVPALMASALVGQLRALGKHGEEIPGLKFNVVGQHRDDFLLSDTEMGVALRTGPRGLDFSDRLTERTVTIAALHPDGSVAIQKDFTVITVGSSVRSLSGSCGCGGTPAARGELRVPAVYRDLEPPAWCRPADEDGAPKLVIDAHDIELAGSIGGSTVFVDAGSSDMLVGALRIVDPAGGRVHGLRLQLQGRGHDLFELVQTESGAELRVGSAGLDSESRVTTHTLTVSAHTDKQTVLLKDFTIITRGPRPKGACACVGGSGSPLRVPASATPTDTRAGCEAQP